MSSSDTPADQGTAAPFAAEPFVEIRYSLPELLRDVRRDRTSLAFAMEKLDQAAINSLFEQQQARRDPSLRQ